MTSALCRVIAQMSSQNNIDAAAVLKTKHVTAPLSATAACSCLLCALVCSAYTIAHKGKYAWYQYARQGSRQARNDDQISLAERSQGKDDIVIVSLNRSGLRIKHSSSSSCAAAGRMLCRDVDIFSTSMLPRPKPSASH